MVREPKTWYGRQQLKVEKQLLLCMEECRDPDTWTIFYLAKATRNEEDAVWALDFVRGESKGERLEQHLKCWKSEADKALAEKISSRHEAAVIVRLSKLMSWKQVEKAQTKGEREAALWWIAEYLLTLFAGEDGKYKLRNVVKELDGVQAADEH